MAGNNYRQRGQDLHELLEALDLGAATLLGWSLGVFDVFSYLEQYRADGIAGLVLVDESPKIVKDNEDDWGEGNAEEVAGLIEVVNEPGDLSSSANTWRRDSRARRQPWSWTR